MKQKQPTKQKAQKRVSTPSDTQTEKLSQVKVERNKPSKAPTPKGKQAKGTVQKNKPQPEAKAKPAVKAEGKAKAQPPKVAKNTTSKPKQKKDPCLLRAVTVPTNEIILALLEGLQEDKPGFQLNLVPVIQLVKEGKCYDAYIELERLLCSFEDHSAADCWYAQQALASLKKVVDVSHNDIQLLQSEEDWLADEAYCKASSERLNAYWSPTSEQKGSPYLLTRGMTPELFDLLVSRSEEFCAHVLGSSYEEWESWCLEAAHAAHHGPGSTYVVRGRDVCLTHKMGANDVTTLAKEIASNFLTYHREELVARNIDKDLYYAPDGDAGEDNFVFRRHALRDVLNQILAESVVDHDRLTFVPKSIKTYRSIGVQPTLNMFCQLGFGSVIASQLKLKAGIDLSDQTKNHRLAYEGSKHWQSPDSLCTLDKSSASNLLSCAVIWKFFPFHMADTLMRLRCDTYEYQFVGDPEPTIRPYYMYAGMGNGTTFPVQTLVFASMVYAVYCHVYGDMTPEVFVRDFADSYAVYGDDVIVRRQAVYVYKDYATCLGLKINSQKSHYKPWDPYRESCGKDYYQGVNVRPAYVKGNGRTHILSLIGLHNVLCENMTFPLPTVRKRLRDIYIKHVNGTLPISYNDDSGFYPDDFKPRPIHGSSWSKDWQRHKTYRLLALPVRKAVKELLPEQYMFLALNGGQQQFNLRWRETVRNLESAVTVKMVPEDDSLFYDKVVGLRVLQRMLQQLAGFKALPNDAYKTYQQVRASARSRTSKSST